MPEYYVTLPIREKAIEKYLVDRLSVYPDVQIKTTFSHKFTCLEISSKMACMRKIIASVLASCVTLFYKYRVLEKLITDTESVGIEYYSLIGALLGVELDDEIRTLEKRLMNSTAFDVEGIWNFRINDMIDSWQGLTGLASKLLDNCDTEDDVYELTAFLVNLDKSTPPKVRIESEPFEIFVDDVKLVIGELTDNENYNLIASIMRERPLSIIVKNPEALDGKLLDAIRKLGAR